MFLDSTYIPEQEQIISDVNIVDVAALIAQLGDRPFLVKSSKDHLTVEDITNVCFFAQGMHISKTGRSLFGEDFFVDDNKIANPKILALFGPMRKRVTPFNMSDEIRKKLTPPIRGFNYENNQLVCGTAFALLALNRSDVRSFIVNSEPFINACASEDKKLRKADIKKLFDSQMLKPDNLDNTWSMSDTPIFQNIEEEYDDSERA